MKKCTRCKEVKSLDEFHNCKSKKSGKMSHCKICRNSYNRKKSKEIGYDVLYKRALDKNPEAYRKNSRDYYQRNKQVAIDRVAQWRKENPGCRQVEYQKNREKIIAYVSEWARNNPEKRREISRRHNKKVRKTPEGKSIELCRKMLTRCLMLSGKKKTTKTESHLGYTRLELKNRIESLFDEGMSWDNHGEWHVDHIRPISSFVADGITDPKIINALDNLQPLWAFDNLSKGAKHEP